MNRLFAIEDQIMGDIGPRQQHYEVLPVTGVETFAGWTVPPDPEPVPSPQPEPLPGPDPAPLPRAVDEP